MAHARRVIPAALCALALCLCLCLPASAAPVAPVARADAYHKHGHRAVRGHRVQCARTRPKGHAKKGAAHANRNWLRAKRTSFHSSRGHPHHSTHPAGCRGARKRHTTATHHNSRHPSANRRAHRSPAAAHSSSCPDADIRPNEQDLERIRAATLCLVNRERTGRGESPLSEDARLEQSAQAHTEDMAFGGYFEHVGPHGDTPLTRMRAAGYIHGSSIGYEVGENIAWGTLWLATPRSIVAGWMASPGHRENILDARFRDTGVGVSPHPPSPLARGQAGAIYTEDFGVIITS
ncbi:MAG: CAP domain-containing protein [Solirubrobacterales bacterium]